MTGISNVNIEEILGLLPVQITGSEERFHANGMRIDMPATVDLEEFVEMFDVLASLTGKTTPNDFLNVLFEVFSSSSASLRSGSSSLADKPMSIATLASILLLFVGGEESDNLFTIFRLYEAQQSSDREAGSRPFPPGHVSEYCLFQHLEALFRVLYEIPKRPGVAITPEDLAFHIAEKLLAERSSTSSALTFPEFSNLANYGLQEARFFLDQTASLNASISTASEGEDFEGLDDELETGVNANDTNFVSRPDGIQKYEEERDEEDEDEDDEDGVNLEDSLVAASLVDYDGGPVEIGRAQKLLGLTKLPPEEVLTALIYATNDDGRLFLSSYQHCMSKLVGRHYEKNLSVLQRSVVDHIIYQLFAVFDLDGEQSIHTLELGWALLLFCGGDEFIKSRAASALMHSLGRVRDGVTFQEMALCLASVLKAARGLDANFLIPQTPREIAIELTAKCFSDVDENWEEYDNFVIDVLHFEKWFGSLMSQFERISALSAEAESIESAPNSVASSQTFDQEEKWGRRVFAPDADEQTDGVRSRGLTIQIPGEEDEDIDDDDDEVYKYVEVEASDIPSGSEDTEVFAMPSEVVLQLRKAQNILGLEGYPATDLIETLSESSQMDMLTLPAWLSVLKHISRLSGANDKGISEALTLGRRLFDAFGYAEEEGERVVRYRLFAAGLLLLCGSPVDDKLLVACNLLDTDNDGHITQNEFNHLVLAALQVVTTCSPAAAAKVSAARTSLHTLALAVGGEILSMFDLKHGATISFETVFKFSRGCMQVASLSE